LLSFGLAQLTFEGHFEIFTQLNLHQAYIDHDASSASAEQYVNLYWPEANRTVLNPDRETLFSGPDGLKMNIDFAHSVFPLSQWAHSLGPFEITDVGGGIANTHWRWRVDWQANTTAVVSIGYYDDVFEKRNETWKCLVRVSHDDPNWPLYLFAPYSLNADRLFKAS
jgi:hypothetical protein